MSTVVMFEKLNTESCYQRFHQQPIFDDAGASTIHEPAPHAYPSSPIHVPVAISAARDCQILFKNTQNV